MILLRSCCFNWKVWAGAGAVLLVVFLLAPGALGAVFPVAVGLACPLSMAAMMWSMRASGGSADAGVGRRDDDEARIAALQAEIARLRRAPAVRYGGDTAAHPSDQRSLAVRAP